jgi:hypothetical protein
MRGDQCSQNSSAVVAIQIHPRRWRRAAERAGERIGDSRSLDAGWRADYQGPEE